LEKFPDPIVLHALDAGGVRSGVSPVGAAEAVPERKGLAEVVVLIRKVSGVVNPMEAGGDQEQAKLPFETGGKVYIGVD